MFDSNDPFGGFQIGGGNKPQSVPQSAPVGNGGATSGSPFPSGGQTGSGGEQKYQILNMFWLINPKAYSGDKMLDGEVHFSSISYNINFGNLRIELGTMSQDSIVGQMICLNKINRLANATVYPAAMFQVVSGVPEVYCMEQIINYTNSDWQNKLKPAAFKTSEKGIVLSIESNCYEFTGWQKEALLYACKFGLGQGLVLSGEGLKNR
jgi:hypothetical protein